MITNSNRWGTQQLVVMALMCAIGILLSFIEFALFPAASWLKYDASFVPALICGFAYGGGAGACVGVLTALLHSLFTGHVWGGVVNALVVCAYVVPSAAIYARHRTKKGAVCGLMAAGICSLAIALVCNLVITPLYTGFPVEAVVALIIPVLLPFNAIKALVNCAITFCVYKPISNIVSPHKQTPGIQTLSARAPQTQVVGAQALSERASQTQIPNNHASSNQAPFNHTPSNHALENETARRP